MARTFSSMRSSASSQDTRSHLFSPRSPARFMGWPVGMVHGFGHLQAAHAQRALVERVVGIALHLLQLAVLRVVQHAAAVVAAGPRPGGRARDGVLAVLPLPFASVAFVVIVRHGCLLSLLLRCANRTGEAGNPPGMPCAWRAVSLRRRDAARPCRSRHRIWTYR